MVTKRAAKRRRKPRATRTVGEEVWSDESWTVKYGELKRRSGRPRRTEPLFKAVAEKIPFGALRAVRQDHRERGASEEGVYIAHDSMGVPRYIGRGRIFSRLRQRYSARRLELMYFSFYVVAAKTHEREIETLLIRAAGPQLHFNTKKKRVDTQPGRIRDYEAGTTFYVRQGRKGRKREGTRKRRR